MRHLLTTAPAANCDFGNPADRWSFSLSAPTTVTINLSSTAFDTVVCLFNSSNQFLGGDADSGPGTNSRLVATNLAAGLYYMEVTTDSPGGAGGLYTLSLQSGFQPGTPISLGQTVTGNLSSTAANSFCNFGTPADRYQFNLATTTTVTINLSSSAFDTFVCVFNSSNQFLAGDDNSGGGTNSRLVATLSGGLYYIEVTTRSPGGTGGAYTLSLQ